MIFAWHGHLSCFEGIGPWTVVFRTINFERSNICIEFCILILRGSIENPSVFFDGGFFWFEIQ